VSTTVRALGWLAFPARLLLGGLFVFAGVMKLLNPTLFAQAIGAFKFNLPDHLLVVSAFVTPWVEIVAGAAMVLGVWSRAAAGLICVMLVGFLGALASVLVRGLDVHCSCFGEFEYPCTGAVGWCQIVRNTVLLVLGLTVVFLGPGPLAIDRESTK
jgi:uncharacterized membrane protein YphA (DoxX/SURF4 family)